MTLTAADGECHEEPPGLVPPEVAALGHQEEGEEEEEEEEEMVEELVEGPGGCGGGLPRVSRRRGGVHSDYYTLHFLIHHYIFNTIHYFYTFKNLWNSSYSQSLFSTQNSVSQEV